MSKRIPLHRIRLFACGAVETKESPLLSMDGWPKAGVVLAPDPDTTAHTNLVSHALSYLFTFMAAALILIGAMPGRAAAQTFRTGMADDLMPVQSIVRNSVSNLRAEGDSLWVGPYLTLTDDGGQSWQAVGTDLLQNPDNRVFSIDVEGQVVWAGLGYSSQLAGEAIPAAGGFLYSEDGGRTFTYRFPQLDIPGDTLVTYGVSKLFALDVVTPEKSPPYDIDYDPNTATVWTAAWASGLRRSTDKGLTWQRVVLPPDNREEISPDSAYDFQLNPVPEQGGSYNHTAFSVLVDETGTVWAGTPMGLNRSIDGGLSWKRFSYDGTQNSIAGNWVVSIEEQPDPGRNPVWIAGLNPFETGVQTPNGVAVTRDGGETFQQVLVGVQASDFAFGPGVVYVAGRQDGLFISDDAGVTWRSVVDFHDPVRPDRIHKPRLDVMAVATTSDAVWVGTSDGLFKSTDSGNTWQVFRANVPVDPATPTANMPKVESYAYPNPFSPAADTFVRIRYDLAANVEVDIRIFDFGMHLVRQLTHDSQPAGESEVVWDGTDGAGLRVANGVYFYAVRTGEQTTWGKILVLE